MSGEEFSASQLGGDIPDSQLSSNNIVGDLDFQQFNLSFGEKKFNTNGIEFDETRNLKINNKQFLVTGEDGKIISNKLYILNDDFNVNGQVQAETYLQGKSYTDELYSNKLEVQNAVTLGSTLKVLGNADLNGSLDVQNAVTLRSTLKVLDNTDIDGTLDVSGNAGIGSLNVSGDANLDGTLDVSGNAGIGSLNVSGDANLDGTLDVSGNAGIGSLNVSGDTNINGTLDVSGSLSATGITCPNFLSTVPGISYTTDQYLTPTNVNSSSTHKIFDESNTNTVSSTLISVTVTYDEPIILKNIFYEMTINGNFVVKIEGVNDDNTKDIIFEETRSSSLITSSYTSSDFEVSAYKKFNISIYSAFFPVLIVAQRFLLYGRYQDQPSQVEIHSELLNVDAGLDVNGDTNINGQTVISSNADSTLVVKATGATGEDTLLDIIGARNGSTSHYQSQLRLMNYDNDNSTRNILGAVVGKVINSANNRGNMILQTSSDGTTMSDTMTLTSSGNVGIGTDNPSEKLHIVGNIQLEDNNASGYAQTFFKGDSRQYNVGVGGSSTNNFANKFYIYDNNASAGRFVIESNGNVGIGTTDPAAKLDVNGSALIGGTDSTLKIGYVGYSNFAGIAHKDYANTTDYMLMQKASDGQVIMNRPTGQTIQFRESNSTQMTIATGGNVGIGTTDPLQRLTVYKNTRFNPTSNVSFDGDYTLNIQSSNNNYNNGNYGGSIVFSQRWWTGDNLLVPTGFITTKKEANSGTFGGGLILGSVSGTTHNEVIHIKTNGNVGIGTDNPSYQLQLSTNSAAKPTSSDWTIASDERVKEDILDADLDMCYNDIKNTKLRRFKWSDEYIQKHDVKDTHNLGFIAQELEQVMPKSVTTTNNEDFEIEDFKSISKDQIIMSLFGAVQKLQEKNENLENTLTNVLERLSVLENN